MGDLRRCAKRRFGSDDVEWLGIIRGGLIAEARLHKRFHRFSIGSRRFPGEWYHADPEILEYVRSLSESFVPVEYFYGQKFTIPLT